MPFYPFDTGGGSPENVDTTYEFAGWGANDQGTDLGSAGAAGTKGTAVQLLASTAAAWAGFWLFVAENNNQRCLIDISFDGGSTWAVQNLYFRPGAAGTSGGWISVFIPVNVPAGSDLRARVQNASTGVATPVAIVGEVRVSNSLPMYTSMESLTADLTAGTGGTRAGPSVNIVNAEAWTEIVASMPSGGADALFAVVGEGASYAANKRGGLRLAQGAAASEVAFFRQPWSAGTGNPLIKTTPYALIKRTVAAGQRIAACLMHTATADSAYVGLYRLIA